jgi:hypothetical protein
MVRAGVRLPVPFSSAVPVEAQHGGVVSERSTTARRTALVISWTTSRGCRSPVAASKPKTSAVAALRSSMPSVTITKRSPGRRTGWSRLLLLVPDWRPCRGRGRGGGRPAGRLVRLDFRERLTGGVRVSCASHAVRLGVPCEEIDRVARHVITEAGYGEQATGSG